MTKRSGIQETCARRRGTRKRDREASVLKDEDLGDMGSCAEVGFHLRAFDRCGVGRGFDVFRRGRNGCGVGER